MKNYFFYIKLFLLIFFSTSYFKADSQDLYLSIKGGASLLYVRDGYLVQNWGTNWGIGATYMIKDSVIGLEIQGLFHVMSGPDYNNDALIYPLMFKMNLDPNILIQLEGGAYYERFTRTGEIGQNASYNSGDFGLIVGLNYMYPVSKKWLVGLELDFLHGLTKPITAYLPNPNTGLLAPGNYNIMFFILNAQIVYRIGY